MKRWLLAYGAALLVLCALDAVWLGVISPDFYRAQIGHLLAPAPRLGVAVVFYLLYLAGLVLFAVAPGLAAGSAGRAAALGAAYGFFAYMTYDLTNLATLRDWPVLVCGVDLAWGTFLSATAAWAGCRAAATVRP